MESCKYYLSWLRSPPPQVFVLYPPAIDGKFLNVFIKCIHRNELHNLTDFWMFWNDCILLSNFKVSKLLLENELGNLLMRLLTNLLHSLGRRDWAWGVEKKHTNYCLWWVLRTCCQVMLRTPSVWEGFSFSSLLDDVLAPLLNVRIDILVIPQVTCILLHIHNHLSLRGKWFAATNDKPCLNVAGSKFTLLGLDLASFACRLSRAQDPSYVALGSGGSLFCWRMFRLHDFP